jgi:L-threonylcarbamoyladenylate synthase
MGELAAAVEALRAGKPVILPTDTVYGLCALPFEAAPAEQMYRLKGRDDRKPTALLAGSVEQLLEYVPELRGRPGAIARALLPGPYTLILPNPARRFPWLTGRSAESIGVRVPLLPDVAAKVVESVGAVAATSANLPGEPDSRRLGEIPARLLAGAAAVIDGGELPGVASTVIDCTGPEPRVLREGAVPAGEALALLSAVLA